MLNAVIIDDEKHCRDRIVKLLEKYDGNIVLTAQYDSFDSALEGLKSNQPDVVFLDVQLGDKLGFDLLTALGKVNFEVVFVTAFDKYAVNAFRFSAIDYLLKPVDADELEDTLSKLELKTSAKDLGGSIDILLHNLKQSNPKSQRIALPTSDGLTFLSVENIVRCQSDTNYTYVFTQNGGKIIVAKTLKSFEELLTPYDFVRVHQSHLINLNFIQKYTKGKGGTIIMTDGSEIDVSVRKREAFLKKANSLW